MWSRLGRFYGRHRLGCSLLLGALGLVFYTVPQWLSGRLLEELGNLLARGSRFFYERAAADDNDEARFKQGQQLELTGDWAGALNAFEQAAVAGHRGAMRKVADYLERGRAGAPDGAGACYWYGRAADVAGRARVCAGVSGADPEEAPTVEEQRPEEDAGSAWVSQEEANDAFDRGDYRRAFLLNRPLAAAGSAEAQNSLGYLYEKGLGTKQDYERALFYYQQAAANGHRSGQFNAAVLYENGLGSARNREQARHWYERAAAQGDEEAAEALARLAD